MPPSIQSDINIQLPNPKFFRKNVLESAMLSNKMQQSTLKTKELQILKRKKIDELKKQINEIANLAKSLHLKEFPQFKEPKEEKIQLAPREKYITPSSSTEESDLIRELDEIKSKLDSISIQ